MAKKDPAAWRSFHARLSEVASPQDYARIDAMYTYIDDKYHTLQKDARFVELALANIDEYRTKFTSAMARDYGKPYKSWTINNAAKYYRIMMTQVHDTMKSLAKKKRLATICEKHEWDTDRATLKSIQDEAVSIFGYRPKYRDIANICKSKQHPSLPDVIHFEIDYSSEDNQVCRMLDCSEWHVSYALKVDDSSQWAILDIPVPASTRAHGTHYARPNIIPVFGGDENIIDYEVMISYEPTVDAIEGMNVLGVDLGKLKAVSMACVRPDGSVSREYLASGETQGVLDKLNRVYEEVEASKKVLESCSDEDKRVVIEAQLVGQREKLSRLRESFARLVGRDVCAAAVELGCSIVRLEDLARLIAVGAQVTGRWNFAAVRRWVVDDCALRGVRVELVDPAFTSRTSPFDNSKVVPDSDRLVDCGCCVLDRDYLAALNIARCACGNVRSCGVLDFGVVRGSLVLSPVRVKLGSRKVK